jgi:hypothetical protein
MITIMQDIFPTGMSVTRTLPDVAVGYKTQHTLADYRAIVNKTTVPLQQLRVRAETAAGLRGHFPKDNFFRRLLDVDDAFALVDIVLPYKPLSQEEINAQREARAARFLRTEFAD